MSPHQPGDVTVSLDAVETRLCLVDGGRRWTLERDQPALRYGRAPDNDLVLGDDFTSRRRGAIAWADGHFRLADASRNGTFVAFDDGVTRRVHGGQCVLDRQDSLRLGHPTSAAIAFAIEVRSTAGGLWVSPGRRDTNLIRREGDCWTLGNRGRLLQLKDAKGLRYLAELLRHPGQEFPALELVTLGSTGSAAHADGTPLAAGLGPRLDARARTDYRDRLRELRAELAGVEAAHDLGRASVLHAEIDALVQQLAAALGLGGRCRDEGSDAERARVAVTQRIRHVIEQIRRPDAAATAAWTAQ